RPRPSRRAATWLRGNRGTKGWYKFQLWACGNSETRWSLYGASGIADKPVACGLRAQIVATRHAPREGQHIDPLDAALVQRPGDRLDGGAGGNHVVDDHHAVAAGPGQQFGMGGKGASDVAGPRVGGQPDLLPRPLYAPHQRRIDANAGQLGNDARQLGGLVVAPM